MDALNALAQKIRDIAMLDEMVGGTRECRNASRQLCEIADALSTPRQVDIIWNSEKIWVRFYEYKSLVRDEFWANPSEGIAAAEQWMNQETS